MIKNRRAYDMTDTRDIAISNRSDIETLKSGFASLRKEVAAIKWTMVWCTGAMCACMFLFANHLLDLRPLVKDVQAEEIRHR